MLLSSDLTPALPPNVIGRSLSPLYLREERPKEERCQFCMFVAGGGGGAGVK